MRGTDVKPYVAAPDEAVSASEWQRNVEGVLEPLGDYLPDWDQSTHLRLHCSIEADVGRISSNTMLADTMLGWSIGWRAGGTGLIGTPLIVPLDSSVVEVDLIIPPDRTGNSIVLTRRLILTRSPRQPISPLCARIPGSILWADEKTVRLSGSGASFPTEVVDFAKVPSLARLARNSWYLDLPASVEQPVLGGLLLMINTADAELASAVTRARPDNRQQVVVREMQEAVIEQLIRWALNRWSEVIEAGEGSVGSVAAILASRLLGDPETWTSEDVDSMDLHATIIDGARRLGLGKALV